MGNRQSSIFHVVNKLFNFNVNNLIIVPRITGPTPPSTILVSDLSSVTLRYLGNFIEFKSLFFIRFGVSVLPVDF